MKVLTEQAVGVLVDMACLVLKEDRARMYDYILSEPVLTERQKNKALKLIDKCDRKDLRRYYWGLSGEKAEAVAGLSQMFQGTELAFISFWSVALPYLLDSCKR
ncbi:hypothetical protein PJ747_004588 [Escherichia coli]|nr:hypothetical protein [Escherichia coli]